MKSILVRVEPHLLEPFFHEPKDDSCRNRYRQYRWWLTCFLLMIYQLEIQLLQNPTSPVGFFISFLTSMSSPYFLEEVLFIFTV